MIMSEWIVQKHGDRRGDWEIALVRKDNRHGRISWGWCDYDLSDVSKCEKILVGSYCKSHVSGVMVPAAFDVALELAEKLLIRVKNGERVDT